ncbi:MAG: hypothetical protein IPN12_13990 [Rhodocyclaceae bacterium]|nr:hypothetical protein [Rhodocyclaceae bacterium]MBK6553183.1 hypothetical protein [Rhodocyclaceae bacterium]MBK9311798.1 hypothetical protein [Rhodocyclaceae bacterium]
MKTIIKTGNVEGFFNSVEEKPYPGHGRFKEVRASADKVVLEAVFA